MFCKGDKVVTPKGPGTVVYTRMKAPDYSQPEAYSVLLDSAKQASEQPPFPTASGTIFPSDEVESA